MSDHATTRMYPIQPAVVLAAKFSHSSSMYRIRNIHEDTRPCRRHAAADTATEAKMPDDAVVSQVIRLLQAPLPEYGALEARQEKILSQLAELKKQVTTLVHFLKSNNQVETVKNCTSLQKPAVHLVLNVNPKKPPYSILALKKLWKDINFNVISHIHSTIKGEMPVIFSENDRCSRNGLQLTLIWKDVSNIEVVVNAHSQPIKGEVNFLRLVSRLIESHNYESTCSQPQTLDFALDLTNYLQMLNLTDIYKPINYPFLRNGLNTLANEFDRWSCKGGFNIVDIAVWSLIKQLNETDLPLALRKWYTLCESTFIGETV